MSNDLVANNRGLGLWEIEIYNPLGKIFNVNGYLYIAKDHHIIFEDSNLRKTILNIPSQNVAWVRLEKKENNTKENEVEEDGF